MRHRTFVALAAALGLFFALTALADPTDKAQYLGTFIWEDETPDFGGFSGLELSEDGTSLVAISDHGAYITAQITRQNGKITAIAHAPVQPLRNPKGDPLVIPQADSEGLAIGAGGRRFVSFEGFHRVWSYPSADAVKRLPVHPDFLKLTGNSGLESLAIDARDRLYTIPERSGQLTRPFPVYRFENGAWTIPFTLPRSGGFWPVGADFGPEGRLYVLEREFSGFGFRSRVRRLTLDQDKVTQVETLLQSATWAYDNLEGIAVWKDASGIRLTMISDDNFKSFQRTQLVEYAVTD
jgi:hypothetical protein